MSYAHFNKRQLFHSIHRRESSTLLLKVLTGESTANTKNQTSSSDEKGVIFREILSLVRAIVLSTDLKSVVTGKGGVADHCREIIVFFQQALDTINAMNLEMNKQQKLKNSPLQCYCLTLLIPALTVVFQHTGYEGVSRLLMQGPVLKSCRDIFQTLVEMTTGATPVFVGM